MPILSNSTKFASGEIRLFGIPASVEHGQSRNVERMRSRCCQIYVCVPCAWLLVCGGFHGRRSTRITESGYLLTLLFLLSGLGIVCSLHPASSVCHGPRYNLTGGAQNR